MSQPSNHGYAPVEGTELYFEIHGEGPPLVMLHGGVNPSEMYGAPLTALAGYFKVLAIHARGHGLSHDGDAPWSYEQAADDVAAVMKHVGISKAHLMGYSFGGGIALQFAIRHPEMLDRLVVVSMAFREDGNYPEILGAFEQMPAMAEAIGAGIAQSPLAKLYPDRDWTQVMRKTAELNLQPYDWSTALAEIGMPTLLVFADADSITLDHMTAFYKLLGGGQRDAGLDGSLRTANQLAIIPNTTHYNLMGSPLVTDIARQFLAH